MVNNILIRIDEDLKKKLDKKMKAKETYKDVLVKYLGNKAAASSWWKKK